ncbi:MAG: hypothetical protein U0903_20865 [Planctomycetales bacterium]
MPLLAEGTELGYVLHVVFAGLLTLLPYKIVRQDQVVLPLVFTFLCLAVISWVGGLLFAIPTAIVLSMLFLWAKGVAKKRAEGRPLMFRVTYVLASLYLVSQWIHLPVRFALHQPQFKILANAAGCFLAAAMFTYLHELAAKPRLPNP